MVWTGFQLKTPPLIDDIHQNLLFILNRWISSQCSLRQRTEGSLDDPYGRVKVRLMLLFFPNLHITWPGSPFTGRKHYRHTDLRKSLLSLDKPWLRRVGKLFLLNPSDQNRPFQSVVSPVQVSFVLIIPFLPTVMTLRLTHDLWWQSWNGQEQRVKHTIHANDRRRMSLQDPLSFTGHWYQSFYCYDLGLIVSTVHFMLYSTLFTYQ